MVWCAALVCWWRRSIRLLAPGVSGVGEEDILPDVVTKEGEIVRVCGCVLLDRIGID